MEPNDLIRAVRRRRGLTQAELARRAGTSQPVVSAYEHGRRDPSVSTLRKLVHAAGAELVLDIAPRRADGAPPPPGNDAERGQRLVEVLLLADAVPRRRSGPL